MKRLRKWWDRETLWLRPERLKRVQLNDEFFVGEWKRRIREIRVIAFIYFVAMLVSVRMASLMKGWVAGLGIFAALTQASFLHYALFEQLPRLKQWLADAETRLKR